MTYGTAESILAAHILERSAPASYAWSDDTLTRPDLETDIPATGTTKLILRVTYTRDDMPTEPDSCADYGLETGLDQNYDSAIRDARDISLHSDVFGVAIYVANADGYTLSPQPSALYSDGDPYIIGDF